MMGNILIKSAIFDLGIQWSLFAVAAFFQTEIFYDLAGAKVQYMVAFYQQTPLLELIFRIEVILHNSFTCYSSTTRLSNDTPQK